MWGAALCVFICLQSPPSSRHHHRRQFPCIRYIHTKLYTLYIAHERHAHHYFHAQKGRGALTTPTTAVPNRHRVSTTFLACLPFNFLSLDITRYTHEYWDITPDHAHISYCIMVLHFWRQQATYQPTYKVFKDHSPRQ